MSDLLQAFSQAQVLFISHFILLILILLATIAEMTVWATEDQETKRSIAVVRIVAFGIVAVVVPILGATLISPWYLLYFFVWLLLLTKEEWVWAAIYAVATFLQIIFFAHFFFVAINSVG